MRCDNMAKGNKCVLVAFCMINASFHQTHTFHFIKDHISDCKNLIINKACKWKLEIF